VSTKLTELPFRCAFQQYSWRLWNRFPGERKRMGKMCWGLVKLEIEALFRS